MFDGLNTHGCASNGNLPFTDVTLRTGDEHSFVKYTINFAPENGGVFALADSYISIPKEHEYSFPWHNESQDHSIEWNVEPPAPISNHIFIIPRARD
uniref:Uncharacterized protein n=1 Tax=Pseudomonas phage HRDY3 TaxID=3236930 RepID=A0AB39CEJ8_9VIRU